MQKEEKILNNRVQIQKYIDIFDKFTSENGTNWLLSLNWILVFELISSVLDYIFLDISKEYIVHAPEGLFKEFSIAMMIVFFVWYSVYNFIFMKKQSFYIFTLYISICIYLLITDDITFNILFHNLNIFEITLDSFGFYMLVQLLLKFIIFYLIFKMLVAIKNTNKSDS